MSHLASQGEALDLTTAAAGLSSKGSAKRERLQQELMQRTGTFYLQVCQDAFRRLYPASAVPATLAELKADGRLSFVTYLERFGGYSQSRDLALVMHQLAFVADCLGQDDVHGAREHLGLLLASTEQAAQDRNWRWPVSYVSSRSRPRRSFPLVRRALQAASGPLLLWCRPPGGPLSFPMCENSTPWPRGERTPFSQSSSKAMPQTRPGPDQSAGRATHDDRRTHNNSNEFANASSNEL